jgi:Lrp/AsnC family transcriptional regulator for asnA, asnC and gidA
LISHQTTNSLVEQGTYRQNRRGGQSVNRALLDDVGQAIIEQLQQDGRRSYATIGKAVGLSEAAVRQRVQKLIEAGVLQIVAVTDPIQVGLHRQAMIAIQANGDIEAIASALTDIREVVYIVVVAGSVDVLAEVVVADDEHLLHLLNSRIRTIPGVYRTETFLYLKLTKQTYDWGAR